MLYGNVFPYLIKNILFTTNSKCILLNFKLNKFKIKKKYNIQYAKKDC